MTKEHLIDVGLIFICVVAVVLIMAFGGKKVEQHFVAPQPAKPALIPVTPCLDKKCA